MTHNNWYSIGVFKLRDLPAHMMKDVFVIRNFGNYFSDYKNISEFKKDDTPLFFNRILTFITECPRALVAAYFTEEDILYLNIIGFYLRPIDDKLDHDNSLHKLIEIYKNKTL